MPPMRATGCGSTASPTPTLLEQDSDLKIRVSYDKAARTITVSDNGIGMSRQEVDRQHRHHRQIGHPGVPAHADVRRRQGRAPDRPVRRRLLLILHRRRPCDAHRRDAPGWPPTRASDGRAQGKAATRSRRFPRKAAAPTSSCTCGPEEDDLLSGQTSAHHPAQVLRPHHRARWSCEANNGTPIRARRW